MSKPRPTLLSLLQQVRNHGEEVDEHHRPLLDRERARVDAMWRHERDAFPDWVIGCDEVGRGPLAGPLVAAAATACEPFFVPGLNDSKKLSPAEREVLVDLIERSPIQVKVVQVSVDEISEGNLHFLSLGAMEKALRRLKVKHSLVLVDGKHQLVNRRLRQRPLIGGDAQSALIAAASIVAKVTRDKIMHRLARKFPLYGWAQNVGYATAEHRDALLRHGPSPHHRRNFAPVRAHLEVQGELFAD